MRGVLHGVLVELAAGREGRRVVDRKAMTVGRHAQDDLGGGNSSSRPLGHGLVACALVIARVAGPRKRGIGASGRRPATVEIKVLEIRVLFDLEITGCITMIMM